MGIQPLFCCFSNMSPIISAITGIGASVLSFAFLIWGIADLWFKKSGRGYLYNIICSCNFVLGFIYIIISLYFYN